MQRTVRLWLSRRRLSHEDLDEVAADAVFRLTSAAQQGRLDPGRPPGAWLRVVADHLAWDVVRRSRQATVTFDEQLHAQAVADEHVAALLDRSAATDQVTKAMRRAGEAGQDDVVRAVATWLDLAAADGEAPSTRRVADRMGVSHTTVRRALQAFERHLGA